MKTIAEIYTDYYIMPQLQIHMYRVAAVANLICENFQINIDRRSIISTCLLHDMGNIIKFDLTKFPEFNEPQGIEYWQMVKQNFIDKYGTDEHVATTEIALEVGASLRALELTNAIGFLKSVSVYESNEMEKMICLYADMRVAPSGIVSLKDRLDDFDSRYAATSKVKTKKELEDIRLALYSIEEKIFAYCNIKSNEITSIACEPMLQVFEKNYVKP